MPGPSRGHGGNGTRKFNKFTGKIKRAGKKMDDDIRFNNLTTNSKVKKLQNQEVQLDIQGLAQHYCIACNRNALVHKNHQRGKSHKQRVKSLAKDKPFSHAEADAAAGMGSYVTPLVTKEEAEKIKINSAFTKTLQAAVAAEMDL